MKKTFLFILAALMCMPVWASRARSSVHTFLQPDGSSVQVCLHGDENYNYYTTPDGHPLLLLPDGRFELSSWDAVHQQAWSFAQNDLHQSPVIDGYPSEDASPVYLPHIGEPKVCVILMEFPDKPFTYSKDEIDVWLNGDQVQFESPIKSISSVAGYFEYSSQGKFRPQFDVYGPYPTDSISSWYANNKGISTSARLLVTDALTSSDGDIDFTQYDNYGNDDYVDLVYVIFSGEGANRTGDKSQPWSTSGTNSGLGTYDGVKACRYGISNEIIIGNNVVYQEGIGVFCHELSHAMGLPDLYDTSGALPNWDNNGPEAWDLMDDGENLVNGMWPMPYVAWERDLFGWIEMDELIDPQDVILYPLNDEEGRGKAYFVKNPDNPLEYYTFENVPETGWYGWVTRYKAQGGMVVCHVNFNRSKFVSNRVNCVAGHPNLTIVPADGLLLSSYSINHEREVNGESVIVDRDIYRANLGGDPFPGSQNVRQIDTYGNYAGDTDMAEALPITDIERHEDGSVSFKFKGGVEAAIAEVDSDNTETIDIFDMNGRRLLSSRQGLNPGLYIVNGMKVLRQ